MNCGICKKNEFQLILDLGFHAPSDAFLRKQDLDIPETTFPLRLMRCLACNLVQIDYAVDPELLFRDYVYNTGSNGFLKKHFKELVDLAVSEYNLTKNDLAVDIGSNDGTLLSYYLPYDIKILGIDPSSATKIAIKNNIPTMVDFFSKEVAERAVSEYGKAKIITATNVFAHVKEFDSFMEGVKELLSDDGVFVSESHHLLAMMENMQYDAIYHEHLRYYSVRPLQVLFDRFGMEVIDVIQNSSHGGTIHVVAAHKGKNVIKKSVAEILKKENEAGLYSGKAYQTFAKKVIETRLALVDILIKLKKDGKKIVGIGAPAKGNTLLNYCKLDSMLVDYLTEVSDLKVGLYSPGGHVPVVRESRMIDEQPDYALLLSWNLADIIVPKLREAGYKGGIIIPNPEPHIIY